MPKGASPAITDHFVDVNKMVDLGSDSQRQVDDMIVFVLSASFAVKNMRVLDRPLPEGHKFVSEGQRPGINPTNISFPP